MASTSAVMPGRTIRNGTHEGTKAVSKTKSASNWLPINDSRMPMLLPKTPRYPYSKAVIFKICLLFAPKVRSRTLSLIRWYLLVRTEPMSTMIPVRMLKNAMKLMTHEIFPRIPSTMVSSCLRSNMEMVGNSFTSSLCKAAEVLSSGVWVVKTRNWGAFSRTPVGKTTEKFNCIRPQSTARMLATSVSISMPCTLKTSLSPTPTSASRATLSESETSDNVARDAEVGVGDRLVFNVQGMLMETEVASIRAVDWGRMQLNFSVVFPTGVLENAPQFRVLTTHTPDESTSAALQRELVKEFPTISILDLRQLLTIVDGILGKISWVINFMAFFSILTGIIS